MKSIIGASLIIVGIMVIVLAFEQFTNLVCHCLVQIEGQPENCPCVLAGRSVAYFISSLVL